MNKATMMRDLVLAALHDSRSGARTEHAIARLLCADYGKLRQRQKAGRVAAVSRALNTLLRDGQVRYTVRVYGQTTVTEWWRVL
jgi:hypothetical protein